MIKLIHILLLLKSREYSRAVIVHLLHIRYLHKSNHPGYTMMKDNFANFVEEDGEIAFSLLARSILSTSDKSDFHKLNRNFQMISIYLDIQNDFLKDIGARPKRNHHRKIQDGPEVQALVAHFRSVINEMANGTWKYETSMQKKFLPPETQQSQYSPLERLSDQDIELLFLAEYKKCKNLITRNSSGEELLAIFKKQGVHRQGVAAADDSYDDDSYDDESYDDYEDYEDFEFQNDDDESKNGVEYDDLEEPDGEWPFEPENSD